MSTTTETTPADEMDLEQETPLVMNDAPDDLDLMTLPEMSRLSIADTDRLRRGEAALNAARQTHRTATDRDRFSTDEGHAGAMAEHAPALTAAEREAAAVAESVERNARAILRQTERSQLTLTSEEYTEAAAQAPFVAEDAARLPLAELRDRVRHAITTNDRPAMYLLSRGVRERLRAGEGDRLPERGDEAAAGELPRLRAVIQERLRDTRLDGARTEVAELLSRAQSLRLSASQRQVQAEAEAAIARLTGGRGVPIIDGAA